MVGFGGQADGVDHAVVGQGGGGNPIGFNGLVECRGDDRGGDSVVGRHVQRHAGAVIEPGDDLGVGAVGEWVVGERCQVSLGMVGFELEERGSDDQACLAQVAGDGGWRDGDVVVVVQVPGDGVRSGV